MKNSVVLDKSMEFSIRIVNLYKYLCYEKKELVISKQLLRSGTSIGANLSEAKYAQSTNDFISKSSISLKETAETIYWLELLYKTGYLAEEQFSSINADATEMIKMLTSIVKTTKSNNH